ncbi:hypothetical protein [Escherichia coli]|uniref:hypothetical protein n=1 Tax=Escherichia coli TaxID=562 RepID=UPI0039A3D71B
MSRFTVIMLSATAQTLLCGCGKHDDRENGPVFTVIMLSATAQHRKFPDRFAQAVQSAVMAVVTRRLS